MNKFIKVELFLTNLAMGLVLSRFAISKLAGWEISVKAFIEMAKPLGIDPTFFRVFTGFVILFIVLGYFATALYTLLSNKVRLKVSYFVFAKLANLAGLLTMVGALFAEFYLRVEPKWLLVYIAVGIVSFSVVNLLLLQPKHKSENVFL